MGRFQYLTEWERKALAALAGCPDPKTLRTYLLPLLLRLAENPGMAPLKDAYPKEWEALSWLREESK